MQRLAAAATAAALRRPTSSTLARRSAHAHKVCSRQRDGAPVMPLARGFASQIEFVDVDQGSLTGAKREFVAERRYEDGTRVCNQLREEGFVPGIVYGRDQSGKDRKLLIQLPQRQLQRELNDVGRAIENTLYTMRVGDEEFRVLPRCLQSHPTKVMPMSLNFLCHDPTRKLKVKIPLEFYNAEKCTGLRQGGRLEIAMRDLRCTVLGDSLPPKIRVNMAGYSIGERVRVEDVEYPEGVTPLQPKEMIFKITGRRGVKVV